MTSLKMFGGQNLIAKDFEKSLTVKVTSAIINEYPYDRQDGSEGIKRVPAVNVSYKVGKDEFKKTFNLNATNIQFILDQDIEELEDLVGHDLTLGKIAVNFNGKMVDGIRITSIK